MKCKPLRITAFFLLLVLLACGCQPTQSFAPPVQEDAFFQDAIFFGDSLTGNLTVYSDGGSLDVVAFPGLTPLNINTKQAVQTTSGMKTVLEAAREYGDKKKIYIMLGINSLELADSDFVRGYQSFVEGVKAQYPESDIYLQSILPVTREASDTDPTVDNDRIDTVNDLIETLAADNNVIYLDVAETMADADGALPDDAGQVDGIHLSPAYYRLWLRYLRDNT